MTLRTDQALWSRALRGRAGHWETRGGWRGHGKCLMGPLTTLTQSLTQHLLAELGPTWTVGGGCHRVSEVGPA